MTPQQPAQPQVTPQPSPTAWQIGSVPGATAGNGEKVVVIRLDMVTGSTIIFLPASAARRFAGQLREYASGLHVATDLPDQPGPA